MKLAEAIHPSSLIPLIFSPSVWVDNLQIDPNRELHDDGLAIAGGEFGAGLVADG
jgi:hypothetical protein